MKRYVEIYTMWNGEEDRGQVSIECNELTPEKHLETLKLLEDTKFIICAVESKSISAYLELPHEQIFGIAKKFIDKGFEWKPEKHYKKPKE